MDAHQFFVDILLGLIAFGVWRVAHAIDQFSLKAPIYVRPYSDERDAPVKVLVIPSA
jgi:hypothetical protein